jgi:hypothetical protein
VQEQDHYAQDRDHCAQERNHCGHERDHCAQDNPCGQEQDHYVQGQDCAQERGDHCEQEREKQRITMCKRSFNRHNHRTSVRNSMPLFAPFLSDDVFYFVLKYFYYFYPTNMYIKQCG